jgi:hypothetical protein
MKEETFQNALSLLTPENSISRKLPLKTVTKKIDSFKDLKNRICRETNENEYYGKSKK